MSIKSSINKVSSIRVFFFYIITKIECWPIFKQDPQQMCTITRAFNLEIIIQRTHAIGFKTRNSK